MAFDASVIRCLNQELQNMLIGARIDKIYQPQKEELQFSIRGANGTARLLLCADPSCARLHLTETKCENPASPPMFCMLLRKHLSGGKITAVEQQGFERIVLIHIESYDELGDLSVKKLIIEIMGKQSNIILVNKDGKIIDSIKRIDISTSSVRQILPGLTYHFPPNDRLNPLEFVQTQPDFPTKTRDGEKELLSTFSGISPQLAREIQAVGFKPIMQRILNKEFSPCLIYAPDKKEPVDFAAITPVQYGAFYRIEPIQSMSQAIDQFYAHKARALLLSRLSAELVHFVRNNIERCEKKLGIFAQQIKDASKREKYKIYGELLTANLYRISYGDTEITVENYYQPDTPPLTISLDPSLSPAKNAQRYYTRYNKAKTAEEQAVIQQKKTEKELTYLESVLDEILRAESPAEILEIKEELKDTGYLKRDRQTKTKKAPASAPHRFTIEGYTVYVGKNNRQNDQLTLKLSRSQDIWLHTKNIPGSHVIIQKKDGEEIPDSVIVAAARLAVLHSKAKNASKTPVDYTQVKHVKKPSGAKPGMVIYDHYNTVYVSPE